MTTLTTRKLQFNNAEQFKEAFFEVDPTIAYVFMGNNVPYPNEASPTDLVDSVVQEKQVWDNIFAAKRITGNDVELVIPRINWTSNTKYRQYDDTSSISTLLSANTSLNLKPMYVITTSRSVYKCVSNNASANSTIEPTGDYVTSNGNIAAADGYIWKYMFNVKPSSKFLTPDWVPAPTSTLALDYGVSSIGVVDGELTTIVVTANGTNYREVSNIKINGFTSGQTTLRLSNTSNVLSAFSIPNLSNIANMTISGVGLASQTYIYDVALANGMITLSTDTVGIGGGTSNNISITTRIYVNGDGVGVLANAILSNTNINTDSANANVAKIDVTTIGTGYTTGNAYVFGSGVGANARVILSPKFGHAYNPAKELNANNVMVAVRIGEIDSTESDVISVDTSFRQFGMLRDPYKYGAINKAESANANSVISQTTNLSVLPGTSYILNEFVYQGFSPNNATAYGFLNAQTATLARLIKVQGTFIPGNPLIGANSGASRTVTGVTYPEFEPYSGDILYVQNDVKKTRSNGQAENLKMIVSF